MVAGRPPALQNQRPGRDHGPSEVLEGTAPSEIATTRIRSDLCIRRVVSGRTDAGGGAHPKGWQLFGPDRFLSGIAKGRTDRFPRTGAKCAAATPQPPTTRSCRV